MLTLFSIPKPFKEDIEIIQRNAIGSWCKVLPPGSEVILFGDEWGTKEVAEEFDIKHISEIAHNEFGTPLLNSLFEKVQQIGNHRVMVYVNADIILMSDFIEAIRQIKRGFFLMVGQRWDVELKKNWDFTQPDWEERLRVFISEKGTLHSPTGIDYFIFSRGLYDDHIPPFAIGRTAWDNWLIYRARSLGVKVIDTTQVITVVHQDHGYAHIPGGREGAWKGPEAKRNLQLAGGPECIFTIEDTTHILTPAGLREASLFKLRDKERRCKALLQHAQDYLQQNKYREAEDELRKAISLESASKIMVASICYALGSNYEREGMLDKAEERFKEAIEFAKEIPSSTDKNRFTGGAHFHLGCIYQVLGEREKAKREFGKCLRLIPDHKKAREGLKGLESFTQVLKEV